MKSYIIVLRKQKRLIPFSDSVFKEIYSNGENYIYILTFLILLYSFWNKYTKVFH
jgi:hypothetical protein